MWNTVVNKVKEEERKGREGNKQKFLPRLYILMEQTIDKVSKPGAVAHTCHLSTLGGRGGSIQRTA